MDDQRVGWVDRMTLTLSAAVTSGVLVLGLIAPHLPVTGNPQDPWDLVQRALGFEALQGLPGWWSTVLPVLTAVAALRAGAWSPAVPARAGWWVLAALLGWLSVDHAVGVHEALGRARLGVLGPLSGHPVETVLGAVGLLAGLALVLTQPRHLGLLLLGAAAAYGLSEWVDLAGPPMTMTGHHAAMTEVGLSWLGLLLAQAAAVWAVGAASAARDAGHRVSDALTAGR